MQSRNEILLELAHVHMSQLITAIMFAPAGRVAGVLKDIAEQAKRAPANDVHWAYDIGDPANPYMTRVIFPRVDGPGGHRLMLHHIRRPDEAAHLHNHPWASAVSVILSGGYTEVRSSGPDQTNTIERRRGDKVLIDEATFHRIDSVMPDTWTLFLAGPRVGSWGFLVDGKVIDSEDYFRGVRS